MITGFCAPHAETIAKIRAKTTAAMSQEDVAEKLRKHNAARTGQKLPDFHRVRCRM